MSNIDLTSLMKNLIKSSGNELASIISEGTAGDIVDWIDTGCYRLNAQMSGSIYRGCPTNRIVGFGGDSQTLKSIISRLILKKFLEQNPTDGIGIVHESEGSSGKKDYEEIGCDISRISFYPVATIEEYKNEMTRILNELNKLERGKAPKVLFILDSYGNLVTEKAVNDAAEGNNKKDFTKQQVAGPTFGIISNKMMKHKYTLLVPNHIYEDFNSFFPQTVFSGGKKYVYLMTLLFTQTASKIYNKEKQVIGSKITFNTFKSRLTIPKQKSELLVHFSKGIYRYSGLIDDCINAGIWLDLGGYIVTDQKMVEQYRIMQDIKQLERYLSGKTLSYCDTSVYIIDICKELGYFAEFRNEDGEQLIVVDKNMVDSLPIYLRYMNEPNNRENLEKELQEKGINVSDYSTRTYTREEIRERYKEIYIPGRVEPEKILEIFRQRLEEYKTKLVPNITEETIKKSGTSAKAIEINSSKFFTKDVLDKLDVYLGTLFKYGSELEAEKAQLKLEQELSKSKD